MMKTVYNCLYRQHLVAFVFLLGSICLLQDKIWGQISITNTGTAFTQNFDGIGSTGTITPAGWYVGTGTIATSTTIVAGTGSATAGGNYNFGVAGVNTLADRALGSLASSSTSRNTEARFINNTGSVISSITISYDGEQWRLGQNASNETGFLLFYSIDGTNFTAIGTAYNFVPPIVNGTAGAIDGNATANRIAGIGGTYTPSSSIPIGATFYLRWVDIDNTGSDAAPAIDNFSIIANSVSCTNPTINTQPSNAAASYCQNITATALSVAATGTSLTYQWYSNSTNSNSGGNLISGATSSSYTPSTAAATTTYYYVIVYSSTCFTTSNPSGPITVNALPADPAGSIIAGANPACSSTTLSYSNAAGSYYWQTSSTGVSQSNVSTTPLTVTTSGTYYIRNYSGICWSANSLASAGITINSPATITTDPSNASVAAGATASFNVTAANAASYQWQVSADGGLTFNNVSGGSGATTATYTTAATTAGMSGYQYQCIVGAASPCASIISAAATLSVYTASSIWTNPITGTNPNSSNPYTTGDIKNLNITVSGIGRAVVLTGANANDRYNASSWPTATSIDLTKYFSFTLTANTGYAINFTSFIYTAQSSGTGPTSFAIRSSIDNYASNIGTANVTGTTISLTAAAYQNISTVTFRFYAWNASAGTGTFSINDFTFNGTVGAGCTGSKLGFSSAIANTTQDAVLPAFSVNVYCADSSTQITTCSSGTVTLSTTGCGLKGTLTQNIVNGVATFSNISFNRSTQSSIKIIATASGSCGSYTAATSTVFNVGLPAGSPSTSTIKNENFESATTWAYAIGTPAATGTGGTLGTDVTGVQTYSSNKIMGKSYSVDNGSGEYGSVNSVTFSNITGLGAYSKVDFSFQIGSLGTGGVGSGAGADNGESITIITSVDGGTTWDTLLTNNGSSNHIFSLSSASPVTLTYGANAKYSSGNSLWNQSAFQVTLPSGATQYMFKMFAGNNRTNEIYALDNLLLTGTNYAVGQQKAMPSSTGYSINSCPGASNNISIGTSNTFGTLTYLWSPNTNISSVTDPTPIVNPPSSQTYTATVTDTDKCVTSANVLVTIPSGAAGTWTGLASKDFFNCLNWGNGVVPTTSTDVPVTSTTNTIEIDATSPYAAAFSNIANVKNLSITTNSINFITGDETLNVNGDLSLNSGSGLTMSNGGVVKVSGNWTSGTGNFTAGAGKVIFNGASQTISTAASEPFNKITINGSGIKTLSNDILVADSLSLAAGALNINGKTLTLNGNVNHTAGSISGSHTSNLVLNNAASKALYFTPGSYYMKDVTLNASATNVSLDDSLYITGGTSGSTFGTLTANGTLATNKYLTLKSNQYGDGIVGNSAGSINDSVTVERYMSLYRAWRFLSVPVKTKQTINAAWQEGNVNPDNNCANNTAAPVGYGTAITYYKAGGFGFDPNITSNPSIKYWDSAINNWVAPTSTYIPLNSHAAYCLFVRGDRTVCLNGITSPNVTTLRTKGILNQGNTTQTFSGITPGNYVMVQNPYAAPVTFTNGSGISYTGFNTNYFYVWDPKLGGTYGVGKYVTYSVAGASWSNLGGSYTSTSPAVLQSGQAFFVQSGATGGSAAFTENAKNISEFSTQKMSRPNFILYAQLVLPDDSLKTTDGVCAIFGKQFSTGKDVFDAPKFWNFEGDNMAFKRDSNYFSVECRPVPGLTDTLFLQLYLYQKPYTLKFFNVSTPGAFPARAWIVDNYLDTKTEINLSDTTLYSFTPNTDTNSYRNRFMIVFNRQLKTMPVPVTKATNQINPNTTGIAVKAGAEGKESSITISPNPVFMAQNAKLFFNNILKGTYEAVIYNEKGQKLATKKIQHDGGSQASYALPRGLSLAAGVYTVSVIDDNAKQVSSLKMMINK